MNGGRCYELRGADAADALDWLHVHADVLGVHEADDALVVWLAAELPTMPFRAVQGREVAIDRAAAPITGLEHDAAIPVAPDLLVRPPWVARPATFAGIELVVPRGGAFGSGEHASTQAALRCLHAMWDGPPSFGDVGTGSGILALYAAVRGCRVVVACDIDAACVAAARELLPRADVRLGGAETMPAVAGLVANMTGDELRTAMPAMLAAWRGTHALVLSGMREHEVAAVAAMVPRPVAHRCTQDAFTALGYRGAVK